MSRSQASRRAGQWLPLPPTRSGADRRFEVFFDTGFQGNQVLADPSGRVAVLAPWRGARVRRCDDVGVVASSTEVAEERLEVDDPAPDTDDPRAPIADGPRVQDELPEEDFLALMGRWRALSPVAVAELLSDAPFGWWITGGWAIELACGRSRPHDDMDVAFLALDLPSVRRWVQDRCLHLWAPGPARLRPVLPGIRVRDDEEQFWLRKDAASPWLLDLLATPTDGDDWVFKKDQRITRPLEEVGTRLDGIPVVVPEIALLFKAAHDRPKDRADLQAVLPRLDPTQREWLGASLRTWQGEHAWLDHL